MVNLIEDIDGFVENSRLKTISDHIFNLQYKVKQIERLNKVQEDFLEDPEYAENILQENKNMAKFLEDLGLNSDELNDVCYGACTAKDFTPTMLYKRT